MHILKRNILFININVSNSKCTFLICSTYCCDKIQTYERFKIMLFIRTKHNLRMLAVIFALYYYCDNSLKDSRNQNLHTRELISEYHIYKDPSHLWVTLTWHVHKYKVHKLHQRYILKSDSNFDSEPAVHSLTGKG